MITFIKKKESQFDYRMFRPGDLDKIKVKVLLLDNLDAKFVFRFPGNTIKIRMECRNIKNNKWYALHVLEENSIAINYIEEMMSLFRSWGNMLLLLLTLDRIGANESEYIQRLCEEFQIPYGKKSEEILCQVLLAKLEEHEEFCPAGSQDQQKGELCEHY